MMTTLLTGTDAGCSDGSVYTAATGMHSAADRQVRPTDWQMCKRAEGGRAINQLIAQLNSIKYVQLNCALFNMFNITSTTLNTYH